MSELLSSVEKAMQRGSDTVAIQHPIPPITEIEELIAALKEAREDSKRLDHLISNGDPTNCPDGEFGLNEAVWSAALETDKGADEQRIRYVIDDAMKEGK